MRTERSASRLKETKLSSSAIELLENQNYVGYFTSCGANYISSIRRAQEVTALFSFSSTSSSSSDVDADADSTIDTDGDIEIVRAFSADLGKVVAGSSSVGSQSASAVVNSMYNNILYAELLDSLTIEIFAYGLSFDTINQNNNDNNDDDDGYGSLLVATSLRTFNDAMEAAYNTMTNHTTTTTSTIVSSSVPAGVIDNGMNDNNSRTNKGMITDIEIVPWVDEAEFLNYAGVDGNAIYMSKPSGLISNANRVGGKFECTQSYLEADSFGKCCNTDDIVYIGSSTDSSINSTNSTKKCDPQEALSNAVMRDNLQTNAEFVAMLDSIVRDKVQSISTFSQCVTALRAFPEQYEYYYIRSTDNTKYDASLEMSFTVKELKLALDPRGDLDIVSMVSSEVDEYMDMFYQPCLAALYGMNIGTSTDREPRFFAAKPWYNHEECKRKSCLEPNMVWDRVSGNGCVRGLLGRQGSDGPIPDSSDEFCSKEWDGATGEDYCKYTPDPEYFTQVDMCRESLPQGRDGRGRPIPLSMAKLMDYFCMPNLNTENGQADEVKMQQVDMTEAICAQHTEAPSSSI